MPSEFVDHFTRSLSVSRPESPSEPQSPFFLASRSPPSQSRKSSRKPALHALLVRLNRQQLTRSEIQACLGHLGNILPPADADVQQLLDIGHDHEEAALEDAILGKLTVALYADALDTYLRQADQAEVEAEWWADVEGSRAAVVLYFVQTFPGRLLRVVKKVADTLEQHRMPFTLSNFSPSSIRALFPSPSEFSLRPDLLTTTFFPHLQNQQSISLAVLLPQPPPPSAEGPLLLRIIRSILQPVKLVIRFIDLPVELTRQECRHNRKALERIRDERAEVLGDLAQLRSPLGQLMDGSQIRISGRTLPTKKYTSFLETFGRVITKTPPGTDRNSSSVGPLDDIFQRISALDQSHSGYLQQQRLIRPSTLTRLWPTLLVLPPLSLFVYTSYTSWIPALQRLAQDAKETLKGFVEGWLVEPLVGVLRTVRAGGRGEVLVREEGVLADIESLQRMTIALARDTLRYTPEQLEVLAEQVRVGDLTPVMQAYEEDIRTPLRSAITGTLLRNAFIQVQKAKVDIDQALSGIDKLLKSQELTFAFVGVAPALAIVYTVFGLTGQAISGGTGRGRYGGRKRRRGVWEGMRRIERLLIKQQPTASQSSSQVAAPLSALPTGLLMLSLTRLRSYALTYLPARVREPFLEDLSDLEDTSLGREAKLRVIDRMWRTWGPSGGEGVFRL